MFFHVEMSSNPPKQYRQKAYETLAMATKSRVSVFKIFNFFNNFGEKSLLFGDLDLGRILGPFWEGLGTPKSMIFAFFGQFFEDKIQVIFWKA